MLVYGIEQGFEDRERQHEDKTDECRRSEVRDDVLLDSNTSDGLLGAALR